MINIKRIDFKAIDAAVSIIKPGMALKLQSLNPCAFCGYNVDRRMTNTTFFPSLIIAMARAFIFYDEVLLCLQSLDAAFNFFIEYLSLKKG